jgi:hypothetical protein
MSFWVWAAPILLTSGAGWLVAGEAGALFGAAGGVLTGWALVRGALAEALAGSVKGIVFVALIGPGADWLISGQPVTDKLPMALVSGALLGAALGIKNARPKRSPSREAAADYQSA